ncbi:MAG: hypothetical protein NDJ89_06030 [Oligoflexia bacterium]|nr:hypothetical protein [Oligoflexia bacterium]
MRKGVITGARRSESGQAVLEYVLMIALALSIVAIFGIGIRRSVITVWERIARDIAAPCPRCEPPPQVQIR